MTQLALLIRQLWKDVRFRIRQFRRAPGHAVFTSLVLALGIGTVTAMFTVSYGVLLKPLPFSVDRQLYLVEQRTHEIGIRMALGADRGAVMGMVLRQTLVLLGAGVAIGIALALWSNRLLQAFLYGVSVSASWTIGLAPLVLVVCGLIAALIPARSAASVNPVESLRAE